MTALVLVALWTLLLPALDFEASNADYISLASTAITGYPHSTFALFKPESSNTRTILCFADTGGPNEYFNHGGNGATFTALSEAQNGGVLSTATSANTLANGSWGSYCGIQTSATDRRVVLKGDWANSGTNVTSRTPTAASIDTATVGALRRSTLQGHIDGVLSNVAAWSAALSQTEVESLDAGASPYNVQRPSLVHFLPMCNNDTGPIDVRTGSEFSSANLPDFVEQTRWPRRQRAR